MWSSCWSNDELITLSGHIVTMADTRIVGIEIRIHRFDVITMDVNGDGVWNTDKDHYASISQYSISIGTG